MENEIVQTPEEIFIEISRLLELPVQFQPDPNNQEKISPSVDASGILSKFTALMVYVGWNVPVNIMPPYNRVHADIEYWKKRFERPVELKEEPKAEPAQAEA